MSLRILFADDSMTAQNMGKKILTDAGYEVVAVSNGAAAVKKIAEHKPDIIILDVYMPGYSGLEVCEKVRASMDTLKTPVLLTVGKMEPYRAEDANRVRADGVIIKPFEASDLLAIVKKLEERVVPRRVPVPADQTILLERPPDFSQFESGNNSAAGLHAAAPAHLEPQERRTHSTVDVPDHMATAAAFSDLLGTEPSHMESFPPLRASEPVELPVVPELPAEAPASFTSSQEFGVSPETPVAAAAPAHAFEPEPMPVHAPAPEVHEPVPSFSDTQPIPVYVEPEPEAAAHDAQPVAVHTEPAVVELEPELAAAAMVEEVVPEPEPVVAHDSAIREGERLDEVDKDDEVEAVEVSSVHESSYPSVDDVAFIDPGLMVKRASFNSLSPSDTEELPVQPAAEAAPAVIEPVPIEEKYEHAAALHEEAPAAGEDQDFEARVAAAMSAYEDPVQAEPEVHPAHPLPREPEPESEPHFISHQLQPEPVQSLAHEPQLEPEPPASFEYSPGFRQVEPEIAPEPMAAVPEYHQVLAPPKPEVPEPEYHYTPQVENIPSFESHVSAPAPTTEEKIAASIEAEIPAATAAIAEETGVNTQVISQVIHRVMERLKPELVEEIVRELRNKK